MLDDVVLEILLLLAYLAIGLIAVTFPIYAISVAFLPQEKWESEKEREERMRRLQAKISELAGRLRTEPDASEQIKEEMAKCEAELKGIELRVHCLTARGAVGLPVSYLALSLLMVGVGFYYFNSGYLVGVVAFTLLSVFLSTLAVHRLYKTICAVEYAALRPARTVGFEIGLVDGENKEQLKLNKESTVDIGVWTNEQAVENFEMLLRFPSEFEIEEAQRQDMLVARFSEYTTVFVWERFLPKDAVSGIRVPLIARKVGVYTIPVTINAKNVYPVKKEVILKVIK